MTYLQALWRHMVHGILDENDNYDLIVIKKNMKKFTWSELFQLDNLQWWTFLQKIVWNNHLYVPQFSQEWGSHFHSLSYKHAIIVLWFYFVQDGIYSMY